MEISNINDLYVANKLTVNSMLTPSLFNTFSDTTECDEYILNDIIQRYGNKCNNVGYINDNIKFLNRTIGCINASHFTGNIHYKVEIETSILSPTQGVILECSVIGVNNAGILCENHPIRVMICPDAGDDICDIKSGDTILVKILHFKVVLNSKNIKALGKFIKK
tara:strand:+ start:1313 stop:1807 length:495 start_codon:yes stop_codon:yes gene_type:complete